MQEASVAFIFALDKVGNKSEARMPIMAMTTRSSTRVKSAVLPPTSGSRAYRGSCDLIRESDEKLTRKEAKTRARGGWRQDTLNKHG